MELVATEPYKIVGDSQGYTLVDDTETNNIQRILVQKVMYPDEGPQVLVSSSVTSECEAVLINKLSGHRRDVRIVPA